jgi:hypothetical protein
MHAGDAIMFRLPNGDVRSYQLIKDSYAAF